MKRCRNPTCTESTSSTYCSRRCQLTMRNTGRVGYGQLPDVWLGMDTERALAQRAAELGYSVRDLVVTMIETEMAPHVGWDRLDFGEGAA